MSRHIPAPVECLSAVNACPAELVIFRGERVAPRGRIRFQRGGKFQRLSPAAVRLALPKSDEVPGIAGLFAPTEFLAPGVLPSTACFFEQPTTTINAATTDHRILYFINPPKFLLNRTGSAPLR